MAAATRTNWRELAEAARKEQDPKRLMELISQLNTALDERWVSGGEQDAHGFSECGYS